MSINLRVASKTAKLCPQMYIWFLSISQRVLLVETIWFYNRMLTYPLLNYFDALLAHVLGRPISLDLAV